MQPVEWEPGISHIKYIIMYKVVLIKIYDPIYRASWLSISGRGALPKALRVRGEITGRDKDRSREKPTGPKSGDQKPGGLAALEANNAEASRLTLPVKLRRRFATKHLPAPYRSVAKLSTSSREVQSLIPPSGTML